MKKSNKFLRGMTLLLFLFSIMTYGQTTVPGSGGGTPIANTLPCATGIASVSGLAGSNLTAVNLNLNHTYDFDLEIRLYAPNGAVVLLSDNRGGSGDNYTNTVFSDAATQPISSGSAPFTGTYNPEVPLSTVAGQNNGAWSIEICDGFGGDSGVLNSWSLVFGSGTPPGPVYCASVPSSGDGSGISAVTVGTTTFPVSMSPWYSDQTGSPVALQQGITAALSVNYAHSYDYYTFVWIDFGDDGTFDAGDLVYSGDVGPGLVDLSFPMPAGAPLGEHRMRISGADLSNHFNPCYTGSWGAVVDVDIEVIEPLCQQATIASSEIVPDCDNVVQGYSVDVDITSGGDAQYITDGTNNWTINDTGINTVGPFANGSSVTLTVVHADAACDINLGNFVYNCPPDNDTCGDAIVVGCGETATGNTEFATSESLFCSTDLGTAPGVWHTVVGTGGDIIIDTNDSAFDTKLGLYSGTCGALVCIDGDDDGGVGTRSEITFSSNAGEIYYVYVTGWSTNSGAYNLSVDCVCDVEITTGECNSVYDSSFAPLASTEITANGLFGAGDFTYVWSDGQTGATISVNPTEQTVYEVTATDAAGCTSTAMTTILVVDVSCSNGNGDQDKVTVCHNGDEICISPNAVQAHLNHGDSIGSCDGPVVSCDTPPLCDSILKVPSPGAIDIPTSIEISWGQATGYVTGYVLSVGTSPGGTDVVDNLDVGTDLSYALSGLDFSTMYYVTVVPYNNIGSATGCDTSNAFTTEAGPWATNATSIACGDILDGDVNIDGEINDYLNGCGGAFTINNTPGIWYTFTGTGDAVNVNTCGTGWDTEIAVFEGNASVLNCVDGNNIYACDGYNLEANVDFITTLNATYYIFVTKWSPNNTNGAFVLNLTCSAPPPPNEACTFADSINCGDSVTGSTVGYDVNDFDTCGTSINTAGGRFYKVEGTGSDITVTTCNPGTDFDTKLAVFSGTCGNLVCVGGNDDNPGFPSDPACSLNGLNRFSTVTFSTNLGDIYYIYVTGFLSNEGNYQLSVSCGGAPIANNGGTELGEWTMYPNPASNGEVELDLTNYLNTDLEIQMMDFSGKLLINKAESNLQNPRYRMNTQNVSNGLYFVRVVTESGISIKKLIIAN